MIYNQIVTWTAFAILAMFYFALAPPVILIHPWNVIAHLREETNGCGKMVGRMARPRKEVDLHLLGKPALKYNLSFLCLIYVP